MHDLAYKEHDFSCLMHRSEIFFNIQPELHTIYQGSLKMSRRTKEENVTGSVSEPYQDVVCEKVYFLLSYTEGNLDI